MSAPDRTLISTLRGDVRCVHVGGVAAYRVGYPPTSWEWTPWEFATDGRFTGRWDDPAGVWRTLYVGATHLSCYLEVLAYARTSDELSAALDEIVDDDEGEFPTIAPGRVGMRVAAELAASALFLTCRTTDAASEAEQRIVGAGGDHEGGDRDYRNQQARQQGGAVPGGHRRDRNGRSNEPGQDEERYLRPVPPPVAHAASLWDRQRRTGCVGTLNSRPGSPRVRCAPSGLRAACEDGRR
ncbi:hypothetical protein [Rhodococcus sp. As11]|uniref:hypothetical protein n=1 Tax=Rhodococcus sp. As11 TaxID=3029189 RepID=UPI003B766AF8